MKNSILSLVTIMALATSATMADTSATYLPLTTKTHDSSWILFGVNGFSNGVSSDASANQTSFSNGLTELEDADATDNLASEGLDVSGKHLASLQGLKESGLSSVKVGVDITGITYEETEPVRSMYIKVNDDNAPNVKFNYKAALENKTMEIIINGSTTTVYTVKISQDSTWSNASTAVEAGSSSSSTSDRKSISEVLDINSSDNPVNASNWDKDDHLTAYSTSSQFITFYKFDSIDREWKIYKNQNSAVANDFTSFEAGSAYWGRVDLNTTLSNDGGGATNLILGTSGNSNQSQLASAYLDDSNNTKLHDGWNMLAFDDIKPYIRHAGTGLILSNIAADNNITIIDDSGVHSTPTITLTHGGTEADAKLINTTLESYKLRGLLPDTFNVRAFRGSANGILVLIGDKKFTVTGSGGSIDVTTLNNQNPFVSGAQDSAVTDLNSTEVSSAYGEFALVMNVLTGTGTANNMHSDHVSKIIFGDGENDDHTAIAITSSDKSLSDANSTISAEATLTPTVTMIDTDFDGTADMLVVASDTPFYVRDATFTRAFTTDGSDINGTYTVDGSDTTTITPTAAATAADFAGDINATSGTTGVYAGSTGTTLVVVSNSTSTFDLRDTAHGTADYFDATTSTADLAKGAVKGVYSLDSLAKKDVVQYSWTINFTGKAQPTESNNTYDVNLTSSISIDEETFGTDSNVSTTAGKKAFFDNMVNAINREIVANDLHGYASHDYSVDTNDFTGTKITVTGIDITDFNITDGDVSSDGVDSIPANLSNANASTVETLGTLKGDLVENLKFNAVYTPNYANYGPLYTMRDAGFDVKAILRATTKLSDSTITWDSIDITRDEDDWFLQNEFNVFSINGYSGYWVYLDTKSSDSISVTSATYTPTYSYYFDNDTSHTTTNNVVGGQLTVTVDGLNDTTKSLAGNTSNVYALISGEEVQMKLDSGSTYTANITKFESVDFKEMTSDISFTIRIANGKGQSVKSEDAVKFDYAKPSAPTATYSSSSITKLSSDSNDTAKIYVFKDAIPEYATDRTNAIIASATASVNDSNTSDANLSICESSELNFGTIYTLRAVAVDGTGEFGAANVSNATQFKYSPSFKGSSIISHLGGSSDDKSKLATVYESNCTEATTQPTDNNNTGISIKSLVDAKKVTIAYIANNDVSFDTNVAWDSIYKVGTTEVAQIQNVETYANDTFLLEYDGKLYRSTFPASKAQADAGSDSRFTLTEVDPANTSLLVQ